MEAEGHRRSSASSSSFDSCSDLLVSSDFPQKGSTRPCENSIDVGSVRNLDSWHIQRYLKFEGDGEPENLSKTFDDDVCEERVANGDANFTEDGNDYDATIVDDDPMVGGCVQVSHETKGDATAAGKEELASSNAGHGGPNASKDASCKILPLLSETKDVVNHQFGTGMLVNLDVDTNDSSEEHYEADVLHCHSCIDERSKALNGDGNQDLQELENSIKFFDLHKADDPPVHSKEGPDTPQTEIKRSVCWVEEDLGPDEVFRYLEGLDLKEAYLDTVFDVKDEANPALCKRQSLLHSSAQLQDNVSYEGEVSSSTSTDRAQALSSSTIFLPDGVPFKVDWIEVVGARQKKGGSSLGERLVGVRDHAVYCIKVTSGKRDWEVLRRYRDFIDLNRQLKRIFNTRMGKSLPSPWEELEGDPRKLFGSTSPRIIEVRSHLIERCLQSLLEAGPPFSTISPLFWFLHPQGAASGGLSISSNHLSSRNLSNVQLGAFGSSLGVFTREASGAAIMTQEDQEASDLSERKAMKLVLRVHPARPFDRILHAQQHSCAGCYKHLDLENRLVHNVAQTLRQQKPRLCEYSGQLFCASCHSKETSVLPAQVLRHWDFTPRRVSRLAKSYLDSIYDQPLLCISSVNPYLFSRVPTLSIVKDIRRKLSRLLSCVRCPLRARIQLTMGSRRYLLENNDYFALRDLEDLSKGVFAVLPGILKAVSDTLKVHITRQCSLCQDTGEWCGAGILCEDPFSAIFPFQEEDMTECQMCHASFHKKCFSKCGTCPSCPEGLAKKVSFRKREVFNRQESL